MNTIKPKSSPQNITRLYDDAATAIKAAQAAMKVAEVALSQINVHDYWIQNVENVQRQAYELYDTAAVGLENSRHRLEAQKIFLTKFI